MPLKVPALPRNIPAQKPVLLLRRNEDTGAWSYARVDPDWRGGFELASDAVAEAEYRFGWLPGSYEVKFREREE